MNRRSVFLGCLVMMALATSLSEAFCFHWFYSEPVIEYVPVVHRPVCYYDTTSEDIDNMLQDIYHAQADFFAGAGSRARVCELQQQMRTITEAWMPFVRDYGTTWGMRRTTLRELSQALEDILYTLEYEQPVQISDRELRKIERLLSSILEELDFGNRAASLEFVVLQYHELALLLNRVCG